MPHKIEITSIHKRMVDCPFADEYVDELDCKNCEHHLPDNLCNAEIIS